MTPEQVPLAAVSTAFAWIDALRSEDGKLAWTIRDENLRLCETQLFLWANREHPLLAEDDLESLARELSQIESDHPLWPRLIEARVNANAEHIPDAYSDDWSALSGRRVVTADLEAVFLTDPARIPGGVIQDDYVETGLVVLLRGAPNDGYRVAAMQDYHPPVPGWPPTPGGPLDIVDR